MSNRNRPHQDAEVTVTLDIEVKLLNEAPGQFVHTVTENSRTLKFESHEGVTH